MFLQEGSDYLSESCVPFKVAIYISEKQDRIEIALINNTSKKKKKKWLDLSNAHLTPASQAERWIKKIQKFQFFFMSLLSL